MLCNLVLGIRKTLKNKVDYGNVDSFIKAVWYPENALCDNKFQETNSFHEKSLV